MFHEKIFCPVKPKAKDKKKKENYTKTFKNNK